MDKRKLDDRLVLPVDNEETLTSPVNALTSTVVRKVTIQDDCTDFRVVS